MKFMMIKSRLSAASNDAVMSRVKAKIMANMRHLIIDGRYASIPVVTDFIGEAASAAGLPESDVFHCQMAVDEACTNIIEHAYGGENKGDIEITCLVEPGVCQISVVDTGEPFDPSSVPAPNVRGALEELRPGGVGLHLMRQLMDEIYFEFGDDRNKLTMVKRSEFVAGSSLDEFALDEIRPGIWLLQPYGRIDSSAAPALEEALFECLDNEHYCLIVDMADVPYISSRGLKVLVSAWRVTEAHNGAILLCALKPHVRNVFETVGFTRLFPIYETLDAAIEDLEARCV